MHPKESNPGYLFVVQRGKNSVYHQTPPYKAESYQAN